MATAGGVGGRQDPLLSHNFVVSLLDSSSQFALATSAALAAIAEVASGGFSECTGLEMALDVEEYNEGGRNDASLVRRIRWEVDDDWS